MTPDEKAALERMAKHSGMTLADALRDGAHAYLRKQNLQVVPDHRQRGHAAAR
jgi:hypothetical protein